MITSILIADISGMESGGRLVGHLPQVAKDYYGALSPYVEVKIAGQSKYGEYFSSEDLLVLPYAYKIEDKNRFLKIVHEVINTRTVLKYNRDIVIFQSMARNSITLLGILLTRSKSKIYLIQYYAKGKGHLGKVGNLVEKILFWIAKPRINGIICSMDMVGKSFDLPYYKITDYIYSDYSRKKYTTSVVEYVYDFGIVGLMGPGKGLDEIIYSFKGTQYKVVIAGRFFSNDYYNKISHDKSENITVINKYFSDSEYNDLINSIQFMVMPYVNRSAEHSSGSFLDAIFKKKPVVCSNHPAFEIVAKYGLGYVYKEHISECFGKLESVEKYRENIDRFIGGYGERVKELLAFMDKH